MTLGFTTSLEVYFQMTLAPFFWRPKFVVHQKQALWGSLPPPISAPDHTIVFLLNEVSNEPRLLLLTSPVHVNSPLSSLLSPFFFFSFLVKFLVA